MLNKIKEYFVPISSISQGLIIILYTLLLIIQAFKNVNLDIKKRFFYEQFSYEIYSSINTNLILDLKIQDECEDNYKPLNFFLKLNSSFTIKYTVNIKKLFNYKFCVPIYENLNEYNSNELNYGNLLKHSININDIKNYDKNDINILNIYRN
jgi:hypothetical protein